MPAEPLAPVGTWLRVLAWDVPQGAESCHLGLFDSSGRLIAVLRVRVFHQLEYSTTPPLTEAGIGVVPAEPSRGGGSGPLAAAAPLEGQGSAARATAAEDPAGATAAATEADTGDTEATVLVSEPAAPGEADLSPGQVWL